MSTSDTKTDDSKLVTTDTVYVTPDGGDIDQAFPKPNVEYDFCVHMTNAGELPSGPFFVQFTLSGDQDPPKDPDFTQDDGLDAKAAVKAVVHFGKLLNKFATSHLEAYIYSSSVPEKPINCAGRLISPSIRNRRGILDLAAATVRPLVIQKKAPAIQSHNERPTV
jgi:hypothetical protein